MADKEISMLPRSYGIDYNTMLPVYNPNSLNPAQHITGSQLRIFSNESVKPQVKEAEKWANMAREMAERLTAPAAGDVYNLVLRDGVTGEKFLLLVEDGRLVLLATSNELEATNLTLVDNITGLPYIVVVDNGQLAIEEV